ncbi:MAG: MAPEG family protein [Reyranellales bacterium]
MPVFFVCAGLLGLLAVILGLNVARTRGRKKISLGDGGDPEMLAAIRAHANLIEWAPLGLLLIYVASDFYGFWIIACLSAVLLAARVLHAGGLLGTIPKGRSLGAIGTAAVLTIVSIMLIVTGFNLKQY